MTLPQTLTFTISDHRAANGARITGETWGFTGCVGPAGAFTPTAAEPFSDGRYVFTHNAAAYGMYWFEAQAESDPTNPDAHFSAVVTVTDPASDAQTVAEAVRDIAVAGSAAGSLGYAIDWTFRKPVTYDGDS